MPSPPIISYAHITFYGRNHSQYFSIIETPVYVDSLNLTQTAYNDKVLQRFIDPTIT